MFWVIFTKHLGALRISKDYRSLKLIGCYIRLNFRKWKSPRSTRRMNERASKTCKNINEMYKNGQSLPPRVTLLSSVDHESRRNFRSIWSQSLLVFFVLLDLTFLSFQISGSKLYSLADKILDTVNWKL